MKLVLLVSGNGGNMKFFHLAAQKQILQNLELCIIADRECGALEFARKYNLSNSLIEYNRSSPESLQKLLDTIHPDYIVTNWHKIIDPQTVGKYEGKLVNLHYSLLPAFGGLIGCKPIKKAFEQGCKFIGPTCHLVNEGVDSGSILSQAIFSAEILYEDAVQLMFRTGCLVLLNGLNHLTNNSISPAAVSTNNVYGKQNCWFSPSLNFEVKSFDSQFWEELKVA